MADAGARLAIRLLQDAAVRGEIDPWDVDVIGVIDGFLDQLRQRTTLPRLSSAGGSYELDLAESSEAFLAASVLVGLKAEVLEASTFPPEPIAELEDPFGAEEMAGQDASSGLALPRRPERHLLRRPVAPPPLQRPVTLGELIRQLEEIAERLDNDTPRQRPRARIRGYSDREAIAQVSALAHREKLPETTAALSVFLGEWPTSGEGRWLSFEQLAGTWAARASFAADDLDRDRVGVFWALLFLSAQGRLELRQEGGLYGALQLRLLLEEPAGQVVNLPVAAGSDGVPAREGQAA